MTDRTDHTGEASADRVAALAQDLDALRQGLEAEPPLLPEEVRRRIDAIADTFLRLDEGGRADPAEGEPRAR